MLTAARCTWEVSEQASRQHGVCAKCNDKFETGALRLRPTGTKNTRLIHPECSHGIVNSIDAISNVADLSLACRQRLERSLAHAVVVHGASGDVPHPDISDPRGQEVEAMALRENTLRHLSRWDQYDWSGVALPGDDQRCA